MMMMMMMMMMIIMIIMMIMMMMMMMTMMTKIPSPKINAPMRGKSLILTRLIADTSSLADNTADNIAASIQSNLKILRLLILKHDAINFDAIVTNINCINVPKIPNVKIKSK